MPRARLLAHAAFHVLVGAAAIALGSTYPARMSSPGGFHLVEVVDGGAHAPFERPAAVVVGVIDGLGVEEARGMRAARWFETHGRCFETAVGSPSISRPMYTVLSSGVEQDRTGVRGNTRAGAAPVDSIWEEARAAGWRVRVVSMLDWWTELFPRGFDEHFAPPDDETDAFAAVRPGALNLVHVLYADGAGHDHGARSPEYAAAVARADAEVGRLLGATNLDETVVVLTADHGHSLRGGHGGLEPRVATVMTCFAGKNVRPDARHGALRATAIAPALALLMGLPFPRHMRASDQAGDQARDQASDDDLDVALSLLRTDGPGDRSNAAYVADRRAAIERFRSANRAAEGASWNQVYSRARARQQWGGLAVAVVLAVVLAAARKRARADIPSALLTAAAMVAVVTLERGSFDLSGINSREAFLAHVAAICLAVGAAAILAVVSRRRRLEDALRLQTPLAFLLLGATLGQSAVYGLTLRFPLPPPVLLFFPLFSTVAMGTTAALGLLTCAALGLRARRARA